MRVVLDTNVIVSSTLIRGGKEDRILRAWQEGDFDLVLSPGILEEMGRTLSYEKLSKYHRMTGEEIAAMLESFAGDSVLVPGKLAVKASRDPAVKSILAQRILA